MNKEIAAGFGKPIREKEVEVEKLTELVKKRRLSWSRKRDWSVWLSSGRRRAQPLSSRRNWRWLVGRVTP